MNMDDHIREAWGRLTAEAIRHLPFGVILPDADRPGLIRRTAANTGATVEEVEAALAPPAAMIEEAGHVHG